MLGSGGRDGGAGQWKAREKGGVGWEVIYFNLFLREMALDVYQSRV